MDRMSNMFRAIFCTYLCEEPAKNWWIVFAMHYLLLMENLLDC